MNRFLRACCCVLIGVLTWGQGTAQETREVVVSDDEVRSTLLPPRAPRSYRGNSPDTLAFSANQPFFDDFSYEGQVPDSTLWFLGNSTFYPLLTTNMAVEPPTQGALTFDGVDALGQSYEVFTLVSGPADIIASHYIDLNGFSTASDIKLSFFLQPQGLGNKPESADSFFVSFVTNAPDTVRVYATGGQSLSEFKQVVIPLDDPAYFHTQFQLIFENYGSLNGYLDHWHLDYVYLGANRNNSDTTYNDIAPTGIVDSPLGPYTSVPFEHFNGQALMQSFLVGASNLSGNNRNTSLSVAITDPVGNANFSGTTQQQSSANMAPRSSLLVPFNAFSDQAFTYDGAVELTASLPTTNDDRPTNNVLRKRYPVDSVFAYDDGEADAAYGLSKAKGFGARFDIDQPDSISAVWISFVPLLNFNPSSGISTYMENKGFRLMIWFDEHPDSVSFQQVGGTNIKYGDQPDHFERYAFSRPVVVGQRFWVGIQQLDALPVGVGLDLSRDNGQYMYWDSLGFWTQSNIGGSLMIRPELIGDPNRDVLPTALESNLPTQAIIKAFPNPVSDGQLTASLPEGVAYYQAIWVDLQGRTYADEKHVQPGRQLELKVPRVLPDGFYVIKHEITFLNGKREQVLEKILIQRGN